MIGAFPYLPPNPDLDQDSWTWEFRSEMDQERATNIASSLYHILAPLTQVGSKATLNDLLRARITLFGQLKTELLELHWPTLEELQEKIGGLHEAVRKIVMSKRDLLGEEATENLVGALDSDEALTEWVIKASKRGPPEIYRLIILAPQVGEASLYAAMCMNTLLGILTDQIPAWNPEAIPILAEAADEYMTQVEDVFLGGSAPREESQDAIAYESLRPELGL